MNLLLKQIQSSAIFLGVITLIILPNINEVFGAARNGDARTASSEVAVVDTKDDILSYLMKFVLLEGGDVERYSCNGQYQVACNAEPFKQHIDLEHCVLTTTRDACQVCGFQPGQIVDDRDLALCLPNLDRSLHSEFFYSMSSCLLEHEIQHALDFMINPNIRSCETEIDSYSAQEACVQRYCEIHKDCDSNQVEETLKGIRRAREYNQCVCSHAYGSINKDVCDSCTSDCRGWFPSSRTKEYCAALESNYCKDLPWH